MDLDLDEGWQISSAGGSTGSAFMGTRASQKIFLKRNPSPFLAALSAEGITPKLIWTKRVASGDVFTAQDWINGRTLTADEMAGPEVAHLLHRVHSSTTLQAILRQVDGRILQPRQLLDNYLINLPGTLYAHPFLKHVINDLQQRLAFINLDEVTVTHGDLNHKNWLLSDSHRLYLVDWDQAIFADPMYDVSFILFNYIPQANWHDWLAMYGMHWSDAIAQRINWYGSIVFLNMIKEQYHQQRFTSMNHYIIQLQQILNNK
ncbi:MAG: phosphotransferase family protein [Candidatus Paralactobacillus gallistercoris]|uniref:Phosphotransferase family protein n=1 Tax=Candidatus Paralactobacillus gallistercoris TaxID=2838724 RepID=A0A948TK71_9LACO|nr:phosphotransferase family protein [Candidatus Paralactobacillus gallistercoris]